MNDYKPIFCPCGHIHMIPENVLDEAYTTGKEIMLICQNSGKIFYFGADETTDWCDEEEKTCYMVYSGEEHRKNFSITEQDFTPNGANHQIHTIFVDKGLSVPMMTGCNANAFFHGYFYDSREIDFSDVEYDKSITVEDIRERLEQHRQEQKVNMEKFIKETPPEYLKIISSRLVPGLDWAGTEYSDKGE